MESLSILETMRFLLPVIVEWDFTAIALMKHEIHLVKDVHT